MKTKTPIPHVDIYLCSSSKVKFSKYVPIEVPVRLSNYILEHTNALSECAEVTSSKPADTYAKVSIRYYYDGNKDYRMAFDLKLADNISHIKVEIANRFLANIIKAFE